MTTARPTAQGKGAGQPSREAHDEGIEHLGRLVSLLRAWSAHPEVFDSVSPDDRQNLFLLAVTTAESARNAFNRRIS